MTFLTFPHDAEMDAFWWGLGGRIMRRTASAVVLDVKAVEDTGRNRRLALVAGAHEIPMDKVLEIRSTRPIQH